MRIIFVRHGHPDYRNDCLTELGHVQAAAAAERLKEEGITEIHSSSCGRAYETAKHTADKLGLMVTRHDFMREIGWGSTEEGVELFKNGHPWFTVDDMLARGADIMNPDWRRSEEFNKNEVVWHVDRVCRGIDGWLKMLGYEREGAYYRLTGENTNRTVAMFSHAGSSSAALSRILNLPFTYMCYTMPPNFTGITVLTLSDEKGALTAPKIQLLNDAKHIEACEQIISN